MGFKNSFLLRDPDKTLAIAGVILSLILIAYLCREFGRVVYLLTGVLALVSCLLWLAIRKSHTFEFHIPESRTLTILCATCFFGLYTLSVLSVHFRPELYERPLIYLILTALMAGITACEIFTSGRQHAGLILIQILLLGVSIAWSQLLIFPSLLGVDPWYHSAFTGRIVNEGFISEGYEYSKLPFFHLIIAATSLIAGLPYKFAAMVSVSLGQIGCNAVFVFLIANYLFKSHRIGLLAALMVMIANHHIFMSYWSIPNAFAAVFIPVALYLLLPRFKEGSRLASAILCTMALAPIILTHTITAICMAILLFVTWGALVFYRSFYGKAENYVPLSVPIIFTTAMLAWWTYASDCIGTLIDLIKSGFSIDFFVKTPEELRSYAAVVPLGEQLFENLGMFLFFAVSFIGIFYMISRKRSNSTFAMAWVGMTPLAIGFFSLISGHTVIEHRWWYFAQILLSIPLAVAICLVGTWKFKKPLYTYGFVFSSIVVLSILLIMSTPANIDNHILSPTIGSTFAYTQSEIAASEFFAVNAVNGLSSDFYYCTNPSSSIYIHAYSIDPERLLTLDDSLVSGKFDHDGSIKILRSKWRRETLKRGEVALYIHLGINAYISNSGFSKIYDSPAMTGYTG
ncbi:hypothetical protein [Methanoculleus oceani]|uniref:Glycosyltransferase RgtA/B/C/D-like domain-containing protein n=1 Tax=Methanoculleus oceani TaxID=2184756 RepID=A0ABD4TFW5_9EURY|nr:hypothetical protein [Methanoculleus sp. CWC-02]MCM2465814.1 hypothetical protein [Methanoculleus sp. CWC-02]